MRYFVLSLFLLAGAAGCTRSNLSLVEDGGGAGQDLAGCTTCGDSGSAHDGAVDSGSGLHDLSAPPDLRKPPPPDGGMVCTPTCGQCQGRGACCGNHCCALGEWCDSNNECRCGGSAGCTNGNICATGGPIGPGGNTCGSICCGSPGSPCPL